MLSRWSVRGYVRNLEISEIGVSRFVVIYFFHKVYIMYAVGCIGFREDILRFIFEAWLFMAWCFIFTLLDIRLGVRFSPTRSKLNNFISSMLKFVRQNRLGRSQLVLLGTTLREKILNFNLLFINFVTIRGLYYEKLISSVCPIKRNY